jgi:hypothetical protein
VVGKRANQSKGNGQDKEKSCADYAKSYVRGFITVYMAWFLGVDVEDGFWTTYFKPLERLWTDGRARKDISLMRDRGLVDKDRLRFTEKGWQCMEEAIARFLKGDFGEYQNINIIKEYPATILVAPSFAYEHGIDLIDVANTLVNALSKGTTGYMGLDTFLTLINIMLEIPEAVSYTDPSIARARISIGSAVRAHLKGQHFTYLALKKVKPSRWLIPIIPYLINLGYELQSLNVDIPEVQEAQLGANRKRSTECSSIILHFCLRTSSYCERQIAIEFSAC